MWATTPFKKVAKYVPPSWAKDLAFKPKHRVKLAMLPTPIHEWNIPFASAGLKLFVKRDDMTGNTMSGNKVRKLEFLLAKALQDNCKAVITCGGVQSNHCRATAAAARELGMDCHLFLRAESSGIEHLESPGNLLIDLFCGSQLYFIPKRTQYKEGIKPRQQSLADQLLKDKGHKSLSIPVGGSSVLGLFGYIEAWQEMVEQKILEQFDDVFVTCGSGGSAAGLAISNYLTGSKVKLHAVSVSDNKTYFHSHIDSMLKSIGLQELNSEDLIDIIDGYKGSGYGETTSKDIEKIKLISSTTGIICDPVYTWKGLNGLLSEFETNRQRFKGERVLFIHTGGVFSIYDGNMKECLKNCFEKQTA